MSVILIPVTDKDTIATTSQPGSKFTNEGLETAVVGDSARADDCDAFMRHLLDLSRPPYP